MIIRSGLIKKNDTVDFAEFSRHWKEVHGPLARIVPLMRAYSQNHIKRTLASGVQYGFHRVDGISQLRFETVADMAVGMDSPEQQACVVDIRGFLSGVTILIQEEGGLKQFGHATSNGRKFMYLVRGHGGALDRLEGALSEVLAAAGGSFRLNRIINRDFRVDASVPTGAQVIDAVLELFLAGEVTGESLHETASIEKSGGVNVIGAYEVSEYVVLPLQQGA
jgi:uncharacterized protein (TIGR02118 family)